jgi:hypothetical protein
MCFFEQDDDETADDFWREDRQPGSEDRAHFAAEDTSALNCEDEPDHHLLFHVSVNTHQLLLASALIGMVETLDEARAMVDAAWSMRECLLLKAVRQSKESRQWNERHEVGTVVQYYPNGRNGEETYLGRTSSPAIDTQSGPVVLIQGNKSAVSLLDVIPRRTTSPEVLP